MSFVISLLFGIAYFSVLRNTSTKKIFKLLVVRLGIAAAFMAAMLFAFTSPIDPMLIMLGFIVAQLIAVPVLNSDKYDGTKGDRSK